MNLALRLVKMLHIKRSKFETIGCKKSKSKLLLIDMLKG